MTFRSLYRLEARRKIPCPIVGVARDEWSAATLRDHARRAIEDSGERVDEEIFGRLAHRLTMSSGDYTDPKSYDAAVRARAARSKCLRANLHLAHQGCLLVGRAPGGGCHAGAAFCVALRLYVHLESLNALERRDERLKSGCHETEHEWRKCCRV